jgi:dCMP deaminase
MEYFTANRPSRSETFMQMAFAMSERATCGRARNGALIVKDSRIVSSGYNGPVRDAPHCNSDVCDLNLPCKRAVHAEANAIYFAAKMGIATEGAEIFCTTAPCKKCAEAIIQAGIIKVIYRKFYSDDEGLSLLKEAGVDLVLLSNGKVKENEEFLETGHNAPGV